MGIFSKISQKFSDVKKQPHLVKGTEVFWNGDFYYVESKVNQGALRDPDGINFYYENGVENATLGSGVIACLNKCWDMEGSDFPLRPAEMARKNAASYPARLSDEMKRFGYKTKKARNQNMLKVIVKLDGENISLEPTNHVSLENWTEDNIDPADYIKITSRAEDAEIGRSIKLAFERCRNDFNGPIPPKKISTPPTTVDNSQNLKGGIQEMALLCGGDAAVAESILREIQKSSDDQPVFLGTELSKNGYCFSSNWKGALPNLQDAFENFIAHYGIDGIVFSEIEDAIYTSNDIFACLLLADAWLLKYGYKIMYLNESPDMCELVVTKSSDVENVFNYVKRVYGIEIQPISARS